MSKPKKKKNEPNFQKNSITHECLKSFICFTIVQHAIANFVESVRIYPGLADGWFVLNLFLSKKKKKFVIFIFILTKNENKMQ